jgi:hypothetical protein
MQIEGGLEEESELRVKLHRHANTLGQLMGCKSSRRAIAYVFPGCPGGVRVSRVRRRAEVVESLGEC